MAVFSLSDFREAMSCLLKMRSRVVFSSLMRPVNSLICSILSLSLRSCSVLSHWLVAASSALDCSLSSFLELCVLCSGQTVSSLLRCSYSAIYWSKT